MRPRLSTARSTGCKRVLVAAFRSSADGFGAKRLRPDHDALELARRRCRPSRAECPFSAVTTRPSGRMAMFDGLQQPQKASMPMPRLAPRKLQVAVERERLDAVHAGVHHPQQSVGGNRHVEIRAGDDEAGNVCATDRAGRSARAACRRDRSARRPASRRRPRTRPPRRRRSTSARARSPGAAQTACRLPSASKTSTWSLMPT